MQIDLTGADVVDAHCHPFRTQDLLDRTKFTTRQTLQAAGLTWADLDYVLMVGGSTRMPMVAQMLRELTRKEPDSSVSVDEAVAHGAALHAAIVMSRSRGETPVLQVKNVNSHSLGVVASDPRTDRRRNAILIPRNTTLPEDVRLFWLRGVSMTSANGGILVGAKGLVMSIIDGEVARPGERDRHGGRRVR